MKRLIKKMVLPVLLFPMLHAEDVTLSNGKEYFEASPGRNDGELVTLMHRDGLTKVKISDLPLSFREKHGLGDGTAAVQQDQPGGRAVAGRRVADEGSGLDISAEQMSLVKKLAEAQREKLKSLREKSALLRRFDSATLKSYFNEGQEANREYELLGSRVHLATFKLIVLKAAMSGVNTLDSLGGDASMNAEAINALKSAIQLDRSTGLIIDVSRPLEGLHKLDVKHVKPEYREAIEMLDRGLKMVDSEYGELNAGLYDIIRGLVNEERDYTDFGE